MIQKRLHLEELPKATPAAHARERSMSRSSKSKADDSQPDLQAGAAPATKWSKLSGGTQRPLIEEGSPRLTFSTHLSSLIPFLINNEKNRLKSELESASHLTVVFDGSTGLREAFAVVVRYMSSTYHCAVYEREPNTAQW